jgi:hypothetical protein
MIDESTLQALVPEADPFGSTRTFEAGTPSDGFSQHTEDWCRAIQVALSEYIYLDIELLRDARTANSMVGVGFFPTPENFMGKRQYRGLSFGVVLFSSHLSHWDIDFTLPNLSVGGEEFPVVCLPVDFEEHGRLLNGRCSAIFQEKKSEYFLTANHCVSNVPLGNVVSVNCSQCGNSEKTLLAKRGHIYLDLALLKRGSGRCKCRYTSPTSASIARRSQTVQLHDGAFGSSQTATVMQGIGTTSSIINGARPQTFTIDKYGVKGDSGCAISSNKSVVGSYSGILSIGTSNSTAVIQGYAHCIDEAMRLFGCSLSEGIF